MSVALRVKIAARAASEVRIAAERWAENRRTARAVGTDFGDAVALLAEQPGIGAKYEGSKTVGVRRLYLSRVRYFVYYKVAADSLHVLAFWHENRGRQPAL